MNMPLAAQQSANINRPSARRRLSNKIVPFNLDLGTDNTNALRRMLEQALVTARNAERYAAKQQAEIERLRTLSITDENTGLLNRRGFVEALDRAVARGQRYEEPAVLLLIDLDGFKATNDTFGHPAGDLVLTAVANVLTKITRKVDDVARLGGDEFAVILNKLPDSLAQKQAATIEAQLNALTVPWQGNEISVRASVGKHCFGGGDMQDARTIYEGADNEMYLRKRLQHGSLGLRQAAAHSI